MSAAITAYWLHAWEEQRFLHPPTAKRIILCRHGESEGNVDVSVYQNTPDWMVGITPKGKQQAWELGGKLKAIIGDDPVICFVSPYRRTRQTLKYLLHGMAGSPAPASGAAAPPGFTPGAPPPATPTGGAGHGGSGSLLPPAASYSDLTEQPGVEGPAASARCVLPAPSTAPGCNLVMLREEPRLREQDFGNFQRSRRHSEYGAERRQYGKFLFRIPEGESGADVYDRVSSFFDTLHRVFRYDSFSPDTSVLIVTHGVTLRCFLMRWFRWSLDTFERSANPGNAAFVQMKRVGHQYRLTHASAGIIGLATEPSVASRTVPAERDEEQQLQSLQPAPGSPSHRP